MRILALKLPDVPKTLEYLVSWVGVDPNTKKKWANTWEPADNIPEEFINEYHNSK